MIWDRNVQTFQMCPDDGLRIACHTGWAMYPCQTPVRASCILCHSYVTPSWVGLCLITDSSRRVWLEQKWCRTLPVQAWRNLNKYVSSSRQCVSEEMGSTPKGPTPNPMLPMCHTHAHTRAHTHTHTVVWSETQMGCCQVLKTLNHH